MLGFGTVRQFKPPLFQEENLKKKKKISSTPNYIWISSDT